LQRRELKNYFKDSQAMYKLTARNANAFGSTFAFLADTQSPTKMQKSYQANSQGTHPAALGTVFSLTHRDEGRTHNRRFGNMTGRRIYSQLFVLYSASVPADE
jgi:hypothetical protein